MGLGDKNYRVHGPCPLGGSIIFKNLKICEIHGLWVMDSGPIVLPYRLYNTWTFFYVLL